MTMRQPLKIIIPLLALLLLASPASQAGVDQYRLYLAARGEIPWQSLSQEEQDALKGHRGKWDGYSSDRQERMRQGTKRYLDLPPDQRRAVDEQRRKYQELTPEERKRLREKYRQKGR